jgi:hypothetical protein
MVGSRIRSLIATKARLRSCLFRYPVNIFSVCGSLPPSAAVIPIANLRRSRSSASPMPVSDSAICQVNRFCAIALSSMSSKRIARSGRTKPGSFLRHPRTLRTSRTHCEISPKLDRPLPARLPANWRTAGHPLGDRRTRRQLALLVPCPNPNARWAAIEYVGRTCFLWADGIYWAKPDWGGEADRAARTSFKL